MLSGKCQNYLFLFPPESLLADSNKAHCSLGSQTRDNLAMTNAEKPVAYSNVLGLALSISEGLDIQQHAGSPRLAENAE